MTDLDQLVDDGPTATSGPRSPLGARLAAAGDVTDALDRQAALARVQQGLFAAVDQPLRIGRFLVIGRLGAGASGVVYSAYDPELDRKVALKVLRHDVDDRAHIRLRREALALARLSHPHVVAIHDVGEVDGRLFIAMELLPGGTLRHYVESETRSHEQVLAAYLQAGEGLAAAHAAGLVHRDFKPDNVLIDRRGRVRVVDFGLARDEGDGSRSMIGPVVTLDGPTHEADVSLTRTGAVLGTPAYMAPEQIAGQPADPRTDQYSFCVALYEALYGERPFEGGTLGELAHATEQGVVRPAPAGRSVPSWIRQALLRGLRPDPSERYPDMDALLTVLRRDPRARWRRWGPVSLGVALLAGLGWMAQGPAPTTAAAPCSGFQRRLDGTWDEPRRTAVAQALVDGEHPGGAEVWTLVEPRLDDYARRWVDARRDACEATEVRHEQSDDLLDRRVLCLDRAHAILRAAVDRLEQADRETVARAPELVPDHALVDECGARGVLDDGDLPPADPAARHAVQALEERIAVAYSLRQAGKYPQALSDAKVLVQEAAALGHAPTLARALAELGGALSQSRRLQQAVDALSQAVAAAERGRSDRTRVLALQVLVRRLADTSQFDEARRLAALTTALYDRLARPPAGTPVRVEMLWGYVEWTQGRYDAAIVRYERALSLTEDDPDPTVQELRAEAMANLGTLNHEAGRPLDALPLLRGALKLWATQVGPEHPEVAALHSNLGAIHFRLGQAEDAERELERALQLRERSLGHDHESLATTLTNLGSLAIQQGRTDQGLKYLRRAVASFERSLGPEAPEIAGPLHNMALAHLRLSQPDQALPLVQRAVDLRRRRLGPEHARTIDSIYQLGYVEKRVGNLDAARQAFEENLRLLEEHRPDDLDAKVYALVGLADVALAQGQPARAQEAMERALPLLGDQPHQAPLRAAATFDLAQALDARGREPQRARALAEAALEDAQGDPETREAIERWLDER